MKMDDSQSQNNIVGQIQTTVKDTARGTAKRVAYLFASAGIGSVSMFGMMNAIMKPATTSIANVATAATGQSDDPHTNGVNSQILVPPEPFQHPPIQSAFGHLWEGSTSIQPAAGTYDNQYQANGQFEPAEDWHEATTNRQPVNTTNQAASPQLPDWATNQLPPERSQPIANGASPVPQNTGSRHDSGSSFSQPIRTATRGSHSSTTASRFRFTFKSAPWSDVVRRFAERAGYQLRMESAPSGTFDLYDTHDYTPTEALDVINGYLIRDEHLLVRNGTTLTLVSTTGGLPAGLVPTVELTELSMFGRNEVVSVAMAVPNSTENISSTLKPLLGRVGSAVAIPGTRQMLVTDTTTNIRRLQTVLANNRTTQASHQGYVYQLRNSAAKDIAAALNKLFGNGSDAGGSAGAAGVVQASATSIQGRAAGRIIIVPESQTNTILINAPAEMLPSINKIIGRLDQAPQQVVIKALLVEVDLGTTDEFGVEIGVQDSVLFDRSVVDNLVTLTETVSNPGTGIQTTSQRIISQTASPGFNFNGQSLGNNTAIGPSTVGGQALSNLGVGRINGDLGFGGLVLSAGSDSISVLLRALSANFQTDVLSTPQIQTTNHHAGQIQIGQLVPVVEGVSITPLGSANPVIRQDKAGLILDVTPHIHADGSVLIDVKAEKSQFRTDQTNSPVLFFDATNGNAIRAPIKDITNAQTQVSIQNGQTIVLGGMISKEMQSIERKVPVLGSIPILGHAFRYDLDQTQRKELLIFLTPYIVTNQADSERLKNEAIGRHHFPLESAWDVHGPLSEQYSGQVDSCTTPQYVPLEESMPNTMSDFVPNVSAQPQFMQPSQPSPLVPLPEPMRHQQLPAPQPPKPVQPYLSPIPESGLIRPPGLIQPRS